MGLPIMSASSVRHLEVVALTPARLLLVLITDSGRVDQRIVELGDVIDDENLSRLRALLGGALEGKRLAAASIAVSELAEKAPEELRDAVIRSATGWCSAVRPISPAMPPTSPGRPGCRDRCARCSRRWKNRWWCSSSWRPPRTPAR